MIVFAEAYWILYKVDVTKHGVSCKSADKLYQFYSLSDHSSERNLLSAALKCRTTIHQIFVWFLSRFSIVIFDPLINVIGISRKVSSTGKQTLMAKFDMN